LANLVQPIVEIPKERKPKKPKGTLFEKLRELRNELARDENVPAYIIFSDASLKDMEDQEPTTEAEFLAISGVGQAKLEKYASDFLNVIKAHIAKPKKQKVGKTHEETRSYIEQGLSIEEIAEARNLTLSTIYNHILKLREDGMEIDFDPFITTQEIDQINKAQNEVEDATSLKSFFTYFEEQMPYWKIKMGLYLLKDK